MAVLWNDGSAGTATEASAGNARVGARGAWWEPPFDVVGYAGPVTVEGYEQLCDLLESRKRSEQAVVVLETSGGDPHAAFRIARALGCHYRSVQALVPRYCKSAGTLIVLAAAVLHMDDKSELGPLDIQVPRVDELDGRSSGLEYVGALELLGARQLAAFEAAVSDLVNRGLSTAVSSKIVTALINGLLWPIAAQVDPHRLVEMHRAMSIAQAYGERLAAQGGNLRAQALGDLIGAYPSHSFVIDRKEARSLFQDVRPAQGVFKMISNQTRTWMPAALHGPSPVLSFQSFPIDLEECTDAVRPDQDHPIHGEDAAQSRGERPSDAPAAV